MANSLSFGGTALSTYGLYVTSDDAYISSQLIETSQLQDKAFASSPKKEARTITLDVCVKGSSLSDLISNIDSLKRVLMLGVTAEELILDILPSRYFNALCSGFAPKIDTTTTMSGTLSFLCADPRAYAVTPTSSDFNIDADPKTITETPGGSAYIQPVWTLTAGETLTDAEIILKNETTDETFTITLSMVDEDVLVINSQTFEVELNGVNVIADMADAAVFPRLSPGIANTITVTGFSTTGTLNISYRDTYA
jgi:predicted phage tail component-like protein